MEIIKTEFFIAGKAIFWPAPGLKDRTVHIFVFSEDCSYLCILSRGKLNFCIYITPLLVLFICCFLGGRGGGICCVQYGHYLLILIFKHGICSRWPSYLHSK